MCVGTPKNIDYTVEVIGPGYSKEKPRVRSK